MARRSVAVSKNVADFLKQDKDDTRLIGSIRQHLLKSDRDDDREVMVIHPSEMSKESWCDRATAHRLLGHKVEKESKTSPHMMGVFEYGHEAHAKYQKWLWEMGVLYGQFECCRCGARWYSKSPGHCAIPDCDGVYRHLRYREVPLRSEEHNISGHADGWVKDAKGETLIEIKTIGTGTIRFEQPDLLANGADLDTAWKNIRRPFISHIKQGQLYMYLSRVTTMTYLYESKANQQVKEFVLRFNSDIVDPLLDRALVIMEHVKQFELPPCPKGGCGECGAYEPV